MRTLELPRGRSAREWGHAHGECFRGEIKALSAIRTYLCTRVGAFASTDSVLAAARAHLPVLERYDRELHAELVGIAEGAALSPEEIVVVNHYTDLRDLDPDPTRWLPAPVTDAPELRPDMTGGVTGDGCSVVWAQTASGRILAQTWDMHATAIPYVMVLRIPDTGDAPGATLLSVTGCLGMAGMSSARVAIAINNLFSTDATLGVVWPAIVRAALRKPTAIAALETITRSPIGSGHHYLIADRQDVRALEASGTRRKEVAVGSAYCHANHCLDPEVAARSKVPPASTTFERMTLLQTGLGRAPIVDLADAWRRLGSDEGWPRSVCTNLATPEAPHGVATCGAIAMNLDTGELWAQQGLIHNVAAERWQL